MRLRLRRDTIFLQIKDGIYFRNDQSKFRLKGKSIYQLFCQLLPYFDGRHDVEPLLDKIDSPKRATIVKLCEALVTRGVLCEYDPEEEITIDASVEEYYTRQIEFIEHIADKPRMRFVKFRTSRVCVLGDDAAARETARSLLMSGLAELLLESDFEIDDSLKDTCKMLANASVPVALYRISPSHRYDDCDLVVVLCASNAFQRLFRLNKAVFEGEAKSLLPVTFLGDKIIIGPIVRNAQQCCWLCGMLRLSDNDDFQRQVDIWRAVALGISTGRSTKLKFPLAGIVGSTVALEIVKYLAIEEQSELRSHVLVQDMTTLETSIHSLLAHPSCPVCSGGEPPAVSRLVQDGADSVVSNVEALLSTWDKLASSLFGLFQGYEDDSLSQVPLRHSLLRTNRSGADELQIVVHGWSVGSTADARLEALKAGIEEYSIRHEKNIPTVTETLGDLVKGEIYPVRPWKIWGWLGNAERNEACKIDWVLGKTLDEGMSVYVPKGACCENAEDSSSTWFDGFASGVGVGVTEESTILAGIKSFYVKRGIVDVVHCNKQLQRVDLSQCGEIYDDPESKFYLSTLRTLMLEIDAYVLRYLPEGMSVVLLTSNRKEEVPIREFSISADLSVYSAIKECLRMTIAKHQSGSELYNGRRAIVGSGVYWGSTIRVRELADCIGPVKETSFASFSEELKKKNESLVWIDITPEDVSGTQTFTACRLVLHLNTH